MNCLNIAELIDERDSSRLTAAERREIEAHLDTCPECRAAFAAHEAMRAMAVPAMSPGLADRCRQMIAAQSGGRARRAGGRPFVVVGLLLAGAAAAAFVGYRIVDGFGADSDLSAAPVLAPEPMPVAGESSAVPLADAGADVTATEAAADLAAIGSGFTVGVTFRQLAANPEAIRVTAAVYRAFLEELARIPNLQLIEIEPTEPGQTLQIPPSGVVEVVDGGVEISRLADGAEFSIASAEGQAISGGSRTLVLVDSRRIAATGSGIEGAEQIDLSTIPTALVGRIETVTGGASATYGIDATAGVVNVILDSNIEGVRVDLDYSSTASSAPAESLPYDYLLRVTSSNSVGSDSWNIIVMATSRSGHNVSANFGAEIDEPIVPAEFVERMIASLQDQFFPIEQATLTEIEQRVIDTSLPVDERHRELGRLTRMNERAGNATLPDSVALAVVDMAARITDDRQRLSLWRMLKGVNNPVLVQPLTNALRNDANESLRIEVALVLANYRDDPVARAALEAAANADPSPAVRQNARWAALDATGRRNLVVASVLDTRLSDAERIEALLFDLSWAPADAVDLAPAIDATVTNEITALLRRHELGTARAAVLQRLDREASTELAPLFIERLAEDEGEVVRRAAANALGRRLDEPGVRAALERAAANDPSPTVRSMAARILASGI